MAHILSMLSGREALWQQRRDRAHARQFLRVTHNFFAVNASGTLPGSPVNIFGANRAPGGAGEVENEFLWNCDIPGEGKGLKGQALTYGVRSCQLYVLARLET